VLDDDVDPVRFLPAPANRIAGLLGRVHYLSPNMYRAFDTSGYGILAQLLDIYRDDFRSDANIYELPSKELVSRGAAFDRLAERMSDVLRTTKLKEIEQSLSSNLRSVLGPTATGAQVTIALPTAEELLAEILSLRVQDDEASPTLAVDRLGDGYRSLLRLAILRTYTDLAADERPGVFLIEEPEAYLNPHLRRYFATTLRKLAKQGNDVLITTHDAAFVSLPEYRTVMRVAKSGATSKAYRCTQALELRYEKLAQKLRRGGNAEVFFATKAVLCEGQDDIAAVRAILDQFDIDPDSVSISLVDCGSRDNIPDYLRLLDSLAIQAFVVTDGDASKIKVKDGTAKNVAAVEAAATGRMFRFTEDIEDALHTTKRGGGENPAHLVGLIEGLGRGGLEADGEVGALARALVEFCDLPSPSAQDDRSAPG
jgi:putative ATP-dependent endonuclease of OLD family